MTNPKAILLLALGICSIISITGEQPQPKNELWTPRTFTPLQLESLQNSHAVHHELATSGVIRIVNVIDGEEYGDINSDFMAAALIQNVESATAAHRSSRRNNDGPSSRMRNRHHAAAAAGSLILDGITSETSIYTHDSESSAVGGLTSSLFALAQYDGVLISISSLRVHQHVPGDEQQQSDAVLDREVVVRLGLPSGPTVDVEIGGPNEVVMIVGTQWSTRYMYDERSSGLDVVLHAPSYGIMPLQSRSDDDDSSLEIKRYYTKSSSPATRQYIMENADHDKSGRSISSRIVKANVEGHIHMATAHSHMNMRTDINMDMDDMGDDDYGFCSGMGMDMNMEGFGASLGHSDRSCLNLYFESWTLDSNGKFVAAMSGVLLLGVFAEWLPRYKRKMYGKMKPGAIRLVVISALHMTQLSIGYACMLAAMTYSLELFLCLVAGLTIGFTLFTAKNEVPALNADPCCVPEHTLTDPLMSDASPMSELVEQYID